MQIIYRLKCNTLARAAAEHVLRQRSLYTAKQADTSSLDAEKETGIDGDEFVFNRILDIEMEVGSISDKRDEREEMDRKEMEGYAHAERECRWISEDEGEDPGIPGKSSRLTRQLSATSRDSRTRNAPHDGQLEKSKINDKSLQNLGSGSTQIARVPTYRNVTNNVQYDGKLDISALSDYTEDFVRGKKDENGNCAKRTGKKSPSYMSGTNSTNNAKVQKPQISTAKPKKKKENQNTFIYQSNFSAFEQQQGCFWVEEKDKERERERISGRNADLFKYIREEKKVNIDMDINSQSHMQITHPHLRDQPTVGTPSRPSPHSANNTPNLGPINHPSSPRLDSESTPRRTLAGISHPVYITPSSPSRCPEPPPIPTYSSWIDTQPGRRKSEPSGGGNISIGVRSDSGDVTASAIGGGGDGCSNDIGAGIGAGLESKSHTGAVVLRYGAPLVTRKTPEPDREIPVTVSVRATVRRVSNSSEADGPMRHPSLHDKSRITNAAPRVERDTGRGRDRGRGKGRGKVQVPAPVTITAHTDSRAKVHPPWSGETDF